MTGSSPQVNGYVITRRQRLRVATTQEIVAVATSLLRRSGLEAVSVRAVAREMRTAPATLYRYFPGIEELMSAVCVRLFDDARVALDGIAPRDAQCRAFRQWALAHRHEFALMFGPMLERHTCESAAAQRRTAEAGLFAVFSDELTPPVFAPHWIRLCGLLAMEVFGHVPLTVGDPEQLFETELAAISRFWS
jgi:AcrR family transcriptional regulator